MCAKFSFKHWFIFILVLLLTATLSGCGAVEELFPPEMDPETFIIENQEPMELPPGDNLPGGEQASANDDQPTPELAAATESASPGSLPLKPVRFRNLGTVAYTVSAWSYAPLDPVYPATLSTASTVATPGGSNPSSYLSLPLGTYTWCYWWELGDTNGDGLIDYAHTMDGRSVKLDEYDSDDPALAEIVDLIAPTGAGDMPGQCDGSASQSSSLPPRSPIANGKLLFSDDGNGGAEGMFGPEYMQFAYDNGQGVLVSNASNFILPAMYSGQSYTDSIIEVDFTSFNAGGDGQYSIIFRSDDVDGGLASYYIVSLIPGRRTIELGLWSEGWSQAMVTPIADESISLAAPLRLRLEVQGSEIVVFINGTFAAGFVDGGITSAGIIGMSITTNAGSGSYTFDNLRIYEIP